MKKNIVTNIIAVIFIFFITYFVVDFIMVKINENAPSSTDSSYNESQEPLEIVYTVTYNANGENVVGEMQNQEFESDEEKALLTNQFSKEGYTFAGWSTTQTGRVEYNDEQVVKNLTEHPIKVELYAVWQANSYTISFDANSGIGTMEDLLMTYDVAYTLPNNEFNKEGYTFKEWNSKEDGTGTSYADMAQINNLLTSGSLTLYAQWDINTYSIEYVYGTDESEIINYTYQEEITKHEKAIEVEAKEDFDKWLLSSGEDFVFDNKMPAQNMLVYAIYKDKSLIRFEYNNGENQTIVQGYKGDVITRPIVDPTREGYDFTNWYTNEELTNEFDYENTLMPEGGLVIYAGWKAHTYSVEFNSNGGIGDMSVQERVYDDNLSLPSNTFEKEGYTFKGWLVEEKSISNEYNGNLTSLDKVTITLVAQWEENTYTLELFANDGTNKSLIETLKYTDTYVLENKFMRVGHTFIGWSTSNDGEVIYEIDEQVSKLTESGIVKLYAIWEEIDRNDIIFTINNSIEEYKIERKNNKYVAEDILLEGNGTVRFTIINYNTDRMYQYETIINKKGYYDLEFNFSTVTVQCTYTFEYIDVGEYDEPLDSIEGVDVSDLSQLKTLFDSINSKYTIETQTFFNPKALKIINDIYKTDYKQHNINTITSTQDTENVFTLFDVNSTYVDTYGPTTVKYTNSYIVDYEGWTRISENKYKCDRTEVVEHFRQLLTPGLSNEGTYMTYKYVTVQINENGSLTIRLYCSTTQSGKVIKEHKDQVNNPQWYMLLAEGTITDFE